MKQSSIKIEVGDSELIEFANIIISVRSTDYDESHIVIGYPGLPNVTETLGIGDAVLYETPNDGIFEVRAMSMNNVDIDFLISQITPRIGITGGFVDDDQSNTPFTTSELDKITESFNSLRSDVSKIQKFTPAQIDLIHRKLEDIKEASQRLGRKDWVNYVAGSLTTLCVSAAFAPEASKALFTAVNSSLRWLFDNALLLLS